ncbi:MAG: hypothetical protein OXC95_16890 [Dehalococcoidia bacterium]|nr:hypothetical protein [Dehalococcoidia bacterium]
MRKLLMDQDAVNSFRKSLQRAKTARSIFELQYGNGKNILLKSFGKDRTIESSNYVDVTPDTFRDRRDILIASTQGGELVSLRDWLQEDLAHTSKGEILKVGTTIQRIAGREGSHIINPIGDDRENVAIAFFSKKPTPNELKSTDFNRTNPWRQFIIDAGMRLLSATSRSGEQLIEHSIDVPSAKSAPTTIRMQKIRKQ